MREILFVAGEVSGDLHAAGVARRAARAAAPISRCRASAERMMRDAGVELIEHYREPRGDGIRRGAQAPAAALRAAARAYARASRAGTSRSSSLIDYPGFNMKVAAAAAARRRAGAVLHHAAGVGVGRGPMPKLAKTVTKAAVILPFEEALLREHGIDATFVGHPLLDRAQTMPTARSARERWASLPTSRCSRCFRAAARRRSSGTSTTFVATARELAATDPGARRWS